MLEKEFKMAGLISRYLLKELSEKELHELEEWKAESAENALLFERFVRPEHLKELNRMAGQYNKEVGWKTLNKSIGNNRALIWKRVARYAAILLLPLSLASLFIFYNPLTEKSILVTGKQSIQPGSSKAVLTLPDGSEVDLEDELPVDLQLAEGIVYDKEKATLSYRKDALSSDSEIKYHQIDIPQGGEYSLTLSDGTSVHLNAMTTLRFPAQFGSGVREVELSGEAYFDVAHTGSSFIVKTADMHIRVLGTEFNVSAYPDDHMTATTLVEGSVAVRGKNADDEIVLIPSQQAGFDRTTDRLTVTTVDTELYTGWKEGVLFFKDRRLEDIMNALKRWYKIEVVYDSPEIKDIKFGCRLNRYEDITPILDLLQKTGKLDIEINNHVIILKTK